MWPRRIAIVALIAALLAPLFVATMPTALDGRHHVDIVVPLLAHSLSPAIAEKIFIALALLLPFIGTIALHDAIFARYSWWPLASAVIAYNAALLAGFLSFAVAIGFALIGAAGWIRWRHRPWQQCLAVALIASIIFFIQAIAVVFLFLIIGGFEINESCRAGRDARAAWRATKLGIVALPVAMLGCQALIEYELAAPALAFVKTQYWALAKFDPLHEFITAAAGFFTYDTGIDLLILVAVGAAVSALALARKLSFSWLTAIAVALILIDPLLPRELPDTGWIDAGLPALGAFLLFAGLAPNRLGRRETAIFGLAFAALIAARVGVIASTWQGQIDDRAIAAEPATAVGVLTAQASDAISVR
jgi:hypothetical protein